LGFLLNLSQRPTLFPQKHVTLNELEKILSRQVEIQSKLTPNKRTKYTSDSEFVEFHLNAIFSFHHTILRNLFISSYHIALSLFQTGAEF
jgi:hypothetical protein